MSRHDARHRQKWESPAKRGGGKGGGGADRMVDAIYVFGVLHLLGEDTTER